VVKPWKTEAGHRARESKMRAIASRWRRLAWASFYHFSEQATDFANAPKKPRKKL